MCQITLTVAAINQVIMLSENVFNSPFFVTGYFTCGKINSSSPTDSQQSKRPINNRFRCHGKLILFITLTEFATVIKNNSTVSSANCRPRLFRWKISQFGVDQRYCWKNIFKSHSSDTHETKGSLFNSATVLTDVFEKES